jgi:hypothetical protein
MKPGFVEWAPVTVKDGRQMVQVKAFQRGGVVAGVDLRALAPAGVKGVTLDDLAERLPARR